MKRILPLLLITILYCAGATAQDNTIRFSQLSIKDGLSQSSVNQIIQDSKGYMWFATQDGLNKFDGHRFTIYKNDPLDSSSISDNFIHSIFEDKNGDLWLGTDGGLNRFNNETHTFSSFQATGKKGSLSNNGVFGVTRDNKGKIWVATAEGGLNRLDTINGKPFFTVFRQARNGVSSNYLSTIFTDSKGNVWIGSLGGGVTILRPDQQFETLIKSKGNSLSNDIVWCFYEDSQKNIWIGTNEGLNKYDPSTNHFELYTHDPYDHFSISNNAIKAIYEDPEHNIWVGTAGGGLNRLDKSGRFTHFKNLSFNTTSLSGNTVYSIFQDKQGVIWVGTDNGLCKFDYYKQNFSHFQYITSNEKGISSNMIWSILKNEDGTIWLGTDNGLCLLNRQTQAYTDYGGIENTIEGENKRIYSLCKDHTGRLWVGTDKGLYFLNPAKNKIERFKDSDPKLDQVNNKRVYCIFEDRDRNIWVGTKEGLLIVNSKRSELIHIKADESQAEGKLSNNVVRAIRQDINGQIWIGTNGGGLNKALVKAGKEISEENLYFTHIRNVDRKKGTINNNSILSIHIDNDILWLGTYGGGLNRYEPATGKAEYYTDREGLANNVVYSILNDNDGNLWMSTNKGISRFDRSSKKFRNFYESDGLQSNEFNIGAYYKAPDGELFMGGINGFNAFHPKKIRINPIAPQVVITDFLIFNKSVKTSNSFLKKDVSYTQDIRLNYRQNSFSFEFSAIHFSAPEKNSYAYILEGLEDSWNYVDGRRLATYTKLDPGTYTFKVKAANSDGIWNEKPLEITITIAPPFWQTWWFRILIFVLAAATIFGMYKTRIKRVEEQKKVLEQLVAIRTAEIQHHMEEVEVQKSLVEKEKEKVEKLLLNILPEDTAEELKTKGKASARHYRLASVMFTDFKGFTKIAESMRPKELVAELDRYFIKFDEIIEKYGIEKIKTIGDAYMCAGGLPIRNKSNPIDIILAGLEIQRFMASDIEKKKKKDDIYWELRIGIHTGELIAGVVGTKRFAYDIWGDTVNIANRMEAGGQVGKVNISGITYEMASEFFTCHYRGKVEAKNKGEIDMYFVDKIRPELSENGEGIVPNDAFQRKMAHILYSKIQYKKAEQFILKLLSEQLPEGLFYHGLHHTLDVCDAAEKLAFLEGIEGEDVFLLKTAALFHDAGFTKEYSANEPIGVEMSKEILPQFGYSDKQVEIIEGLILSTRVPQRPETHLQKIICDADLDYLGRDDFHPIADTLKKELMAFGKITSDKEWDKIQVHFLEQHKYFTDSSKKYRVPKKLQHIEEVKKRLAEDKYEVNDNPVV